MAHSEENREGFESSVSRARPRGMKHAALIVHLIALAVLFATLGQPYAAEKPAGVRRAIETMAKSGNDKSCLPGFIVPTGTI